MENLINLTPPINGVQYGYNDEPLKGGDWACRNTEPFVLHIQEGWNNSLDLQYRKIVCCNNPKDTRFPYLVMPSKKDYTNWKPVNGEKIWIKVFSNWSSGTYIGLDEDKVNHLVREGKEGGSNLFKSKEILPFEANPNILPSKEQEVERMASEYTELFKSGEWFEKLRKDAFIAGYNVNTAKYTQEQMEKAIFQAKLGTQLTVTERYSGEDGVDNLTKDILQSLQPTAKAVVVEMEESYGDLLPAFGGHYIYKLKVETSSEYSQGIVRAIEVIYKTKN